MRSYNSQTQTTGVLGVSWQDNWERKLIAGSTGTPPSPMTAVRTDGQQLVFNYSASAYHADKDVPLTLAVSGSNYTLTDLAGTVETYNSSGQLTGVAFANGYTQTLNYTSGQLTSVSDNQSRALTFTYNTDGTLATMKDSDSNTYTYDYQLAFPTVTSSATKELISVTDPLSHTVTYLYENSTYTTYLTGLTDELGNRFATWSYDTLGETTSSVLADNADTTSITYNSDGTKTVSFPLGEEITYKFTTVQNAPKISTANRLASGSLPAATNTYTYDTNGYLASKTDWNGNKTTYTNNSSGQPTSIVEASGSGVARTTTISWSGSFNVPNEVDTARNTTTYSYDADGNMTGRTVKDVTSQSVPYSTNGQTHVMTYTYDATGHVLTATGPRTDVTQTTTYSYDSYGNLNTVTDPLGHVTTMSNFNGRGQPQAMTDANGVVTSLSYDARGRLLTRTVSPSGGDAITTFAYDAVGDLTTMTLADNTSLYYHYDAAHRVTSITDSAGDAILYTLDYMGNVTQEQIKDPSGTLQKTQSQVFDDIGRLLADIGASSQTTTFSYDSQGNNTVIQDASGNSTTQVYDALNRLIAVTDPLTHTTTTTFDSQDNRTSVKDPRSLITSYVYDGFGQVIQESGPDRGTIVYHRDAAGNVTSETDGRGVVTSHTYDALNRVTSDTFPADASENVTYTYDSTSGGNDGVGRLTGYSDESGRTTLTYDERGNVLTKARTIGSKSYITTYAYNKADRLTQETYPSGRIVTFVYDVAGRVGTVTTKLGATTTTLASGIKWQPFGPVGTIAYGNGVNATFTYDQDYRETGIHSGKTGLSVQNATLVYDGVNDISSITDNLDATRTQTFTYDKDYRVTGATGKYGVVTYTYDADGNRTTKIAGGTTTTYTYPGTSNLLSSAGTRTFTYDAAGNTGTDSLGTTTYTYEKRGRYHNLSLAGSLAATYAYDAVGERVSKLTGGTTTHYQYDEMGHLIAESNGSTGTMTVEYVWLGDIPIAQADANGNIYYVHNDQLNTPQKITNATPTIVWDKVQQPFGETWSIGGTYTYNLRFPGQYADAESGLYYNTLRDYDSTLGRYIESDPIGLDGTTTANMNLAGYASQNALKNIDPTGQNGLAWSGISICIRNPRACQAVVAAVGAGVTCAIEHFTTKPQYPPAPPPNNCDVSYRQHLQDEVNAACKPSETFCRPGDSCTSMRTKIENFSDCANARQKIMNECYDGGDNGNQQEYTKNREAAAICEGLLPSCKAP